jgi:predicted esterase
VSDVLVRTIVTRTHGRYLVAPPVGPPPFPVLVGFHGYAEAAETELERMLSIAGLDRWLRVSVQGLHRFYRGRTNDVVAGWMTRQDRTLAIDDNIAFVSSVIDAVVNEWPAGGSLVFTGFSQGVAMAFRAACASRARVSGIISLGGDVPPELGHDALGRIPAVLLGRGVRDEWYTAAKHDDDLRRLSEAGVRVESVDLDAGHEWTAEFSASCERFLRRVRG